MATKSKREIIKRVKAWCDANEGYEFDKYKHGMCQHDTVHVIVWGIPVKVSVTTTPASGAQQAGKKAVQRLQSKVTRLRERIVNGTFTHNR